ncbi:cytochrome c biogenesis heme-transporting ATPase CcmA [Pseudomonas sp. Marseille-QA0892]
MNSPYLEAISLSCERDHRLLFEGLAIALYPGEMLHVTGPNGSGKSSLLRLLSGLMRPADGEVRLRGSALGRASNRSRDLLWIGHASAINGLLTAEENLAWLGSLHASGDRQRITRALDQVGLRGFEDVPCYTLSAGQQRRVALARLFLDPPPLWILDEPFTALDAATTDFLERHLVAHCEQGGLAVLTTHHALSSRAQNYRTLSLGQTTS